TACAFAIIDLPPSPSGSGAGTNNPGQKPRFISNAVLVKLNAQARANLKAAGGEVNPAATGLPSLDVICRDHAVQRFSSISGSGAHRDPAAAINAWHKLTVPGNEQQITLVEPTPDEELNLAYSGAGLLGSLTARLKQHPHVAAVTLVYVEEAQFVPNAPYYSAPYPTSHCGTISQWAPQFIGPDRA